RLPPPGYSSAGIGVRIEAGQLASSQVLVSVLKASSDIDFYP
ncbi:MAG: hypothetical protein ACI90G_002270, partial [Urechidicola sp.]